MSSMRTFTLFIFSLFLLGAGILLADNDYVISLDGGESFYVNDGNDALDVSDNWTFEAWIKVGSYVAGNYECIMDRRTVFSFYLISDTTEPIGDYAVKFVARDGTSIVASLVSDSLVTMSFGTWYHVAATYDGIEAKLYVNDILADSNSDPDWNLTAATTAINIGGRYWGSYSRQMSNTDIDEIRVSNIARSLASMQTSVDDPPYSPDSTTILLMHLNDQGNPPTYESGTDPILNGTSGDDDITSIDYVSPGNLTMGDQSAPVFASTYPKVLNETPTTLDLAVQINEDGIAYYVVLEDSADAPTVAEVKAGTGSGGAAAIANGNMTLTADIDSIKTITGLTQNTDYDIYVVAEDDEIPPNIQSSTTKIDASTTIADVTPPEFAATYPKIIETTTTTLELAVQINEDGKAYFVVLENDATAPSVSDVKAGTGNGGEPAIDNGEILLSADTENSAIIDSLSESTDYDIYVVAEDDAVPPNTQSSVTKIDASTLLNYRTKSSGDWFARGIWERYNGNEWIDADSSPTSADNTITIQNSHIVTLADTVTIDQVTIEANGQLTVMENGYLIINNGSGIDMNVFGTLRKEGNGVIARLNTPTTVFNEGSKFELAGTNKYIIVANWDRNSTCEISGEIGGDMTSTYHTDQSFGNFVWNCPNQTSNVYFSGALDDIKGNFQLIDTNGYEFRLTGTVGDDPTVYVEGNVEISGGILNLTSGDNNIYFVCDSNYVQTGGEIKATGTGSGNLRFGPLSGSGYSGTFTHSGGIFNPDNIQVRSSYTLTLNSDMNIDDAPFTVYGTLICGTYRVYGTADFKIGSTGYLTLTDNMDVDNTPIILDGTIDFGTYTLTGDSTFTIGSTGVIKTAHTNGLDGSINFADSLCYLNADADYEFNGTAPQITGNLLPTNITDGLIINNSAGVTLSRNTTISGGKTGLKLLSGNLIVPEDSLFTFGIDGGWSEANENSFISGAVAKIRNSTSIFTFPIGRDSVYRRLSIIPSSSEETTFKAEYFHEPYSDTSTCEEGFGNISTTEYWTLDRTDGIAAAKVRLYWGDDSFSQLPDSLRVARWDSVRWVNAGQFEINTEDKWITSNEVSEFCPFTFGSPVEENQPPNPPENVNIEVIADGDSIRISWTNEGYQYKIYSDTDPYGSFGTLETTVSDTGEATLEISDAIKKFYRVTANN